MLSACAAGVAAAPRKSIGTIPTPVLSPLLGWTDHCTHRMTPACTSSKPPHATEPSHHTISSSLKMATATSKPFPSPQADFLQALSHYQSAPWLYWSTLSPSSSLEGCQDKYLCEHSYTAFYRKRSPVAILQTPTGCLQWDAGTATSLPAVGDGAEGPYQGAFPLGSLVSHAPWSKSCISLELGREGALLWPECFNTPEQAETSKEMQGHEVLAAC